jgi:hypothetical protein
MRRLVVFMFCLSSVACFSQGKFPHPNAHAHNDYEHPRPLKDALQNGFISVEADVHLKDGKLLVSHDSPDKNSSSLEKLYLTPLDSLLKINSGRIYKGSKTTFYLMIDIKTEAKATYQAIKQATAKYPALLCTSSENCPVQIFLSGNRPASMIAKEGYEGLAIDGHPDSAGKGYYSKLMPVISDNFKNWSTWNGRSKPTAADLQRVRNLAQRVHAEGKKLRLWAIPDNETAWAELLDAGVDFINTDELKKLNDFLTRQDL